jgi:hypothetical protein
MAWQCRESGNGAAGDHGSDSPGDDVGITTVATFDVGGHGERSTVTAKRLSAVSPRRSMAGCRPIVGMTKAVPIRCGGSATSSGPANTAGLTSTYAAFRAVVTKQRWRPPCLGEGSATGRPVSHPLEDRFKP